MDTKVELLNKIKTKVEKLSIYKLELIIYILDNIIHYQEFTKNFIILGLQKIYKEKQENLINMINK